jgi:hypothetical protein
MSDQHFATNFGIGATDELSLRASVATLVRVLFDHSTTGEIMLALDRRATLGESGGSHAVEVRAQPFGGAIRIHDLSSLQDRIGNFHFDSLDSRTEQDFRLFIQPSAWEQAREFCLQYLDDAEADVLESDPRRELTEEFTEIMGIHLKPDQYTYQSIGTVVENHPTPTDNFYARGYPTVRIYRIFESRILDPSLASALMRNSDSYSDKDLRELALDNAQSGGKGWASAALTLPIHRLNAFYETISPDARHQPVSFEGYHLDDTVAAVLDNIIVPKYQRRL